MSDLLGSTTLNLYSFSPNPPRNNLGCSKCQIWARDQGRTGEEEEGGRGESWEKGRLQREGSYVPIATTSIDKFLLSQQIFLPVQSVLEWLDIWLCVLVTKMNKQHRPLPLDYRQPNATWTTQGFIYRGWQGLQTQSSLPSTQRLTKIITS